MRASFDNTDLSLFPNQFVNAELLIDTLHDTTIAPSAAILRGTPGTFVYKVGDDNTVKIAPVKLGPTQGDNVAITDGLNPGDQIVVDGTDKLKDGAKISIPDPTNAQGSKPDAAKPADGKADDGKSDDGKSDNHGQHHRHQQ
jgi:multidrug efflux system membrane fusion protein